MLLVVVLGMLCRKAIFMGPPKNMTSKIVHTPARHGGPPTRLRNPFRTENAVHAAVRAGYSEWFLGLTRSCETLQSFGVHYLRKRILQSVCPEPEQQNCPVCKYRCSLRGRPVLKCVASIAFIQCGIPGSWVARIKKDGSMA